MAKGAGFGTEGSSELTAAEYDQLVSRIRDWVEYAVPVAETAAVVSKGDEQLLDLGPRPAWHFPRLSDGRYAGYYPANDADAIAHLEDLRAEGATYLVLPNTGFWWLDFYDGLNRHLDTHYETVASNQDCRIYRLLEEASWAADRTLGRAARIPGITRADGRILSQFLLTILPSDARVAGLSAAPLPSGIEPWTPPQRAVVGSEEYDHGLASLGAQGVEFLVIPSAVFDWLEAHPALGETLSRDHRLVTRQKHVCEIHELRARPPSEVSAPQPAPPVPPRLRPSMLQRLGLRPAHRNGR